MHVLNTSVAVTIWSEGGVRQRSSPSTTINADKALYPIKIDRNYIKIRQND